MKLVIKRDQDKSFLGGMGFVLEARVELTPEEVDLVKKYKAQEQIVYNKGKKVYVVNDLLSGKREKCKDLEILLIIEEVFKETCKRFKTFLEVMASFGGEEIIEF